MERLTEPVEVQEGYPRRSFYLCSVPSLAELPAALQPTSRHFGIFIALDATKMPDRQVSVVAAELVGKGMAYSCIWGPDCERVHDSFDQAIVAANSDETDKNVILTTWHSNESLREALWFFVNCAFPAADYQETCTDSIAVSVGNEEWTKKIRTHLQRLMR